MSKLFRDVELQALPPLLLLQLLLDVQDQNGKLTITVTTSTTMLNATMMAEIVVALMSIQLIARNANVLILILQQQLLLQRQTNLFAKMTLLGAAIVHTGFQLVIALIKTLNLS